MRLLTLPFTLFAICLGLPAQETGDGGGDAMAAMLIPAKENQKLDIMLGSWEGKGWAKETPDGESMAWSGRTHAKRVLGGHFIQEDVVIEIPGMGDDSALMFRGWHGYNRESKRFKSVGLSNDGSVNATRIYIIDANTMMTINTLRMEGRTICDRWISRFTKEAYTLTCLRSIDAGKEFEHARGEYERAAAKVKIPDIQKLKAFMPGLKPLKIKGLTGEYRMSGSMIPAPGAPKMTIAATEHVHSLFSDTVMHFHTLGDSQGGFAYEGIQVMAWDPENQCHKACWINNMGECENGRAWFRDGKFITAWAGVRMGQPTTNHTVGTLRTDGSFEKIVSYSGIGAKAPREAFTGTYEKQK